jgi:hypothetical protein
LPETTHAFTRIWRKRRRRRRRKKKRLTHLLLNGSALRGEEIVRIVVSSE